MSLSQLQKAVHVAKDKRNDFGGYNYRTAEGILAAAKAELPDGASIVLSDDLRDVAGHIFVETTATLTFADGTSHASKGSAMHPLQKKGMDQSQITGAASSYARKYALAGLLALDDGSVDPDAQDNREQPAVQPQSKANSRELYTAMQAAADTAQSAEELATWWRSEKTKANRAALPADWHDELQTHVADLGTSLKQKAA